MRKTWRATGSAVGLALAALQGAAHAQSYYEAVPATTVVQPPLVVGAPPIYDPGAAVAPAVSAPVVSAPVVSAPVVSAPVIAAPVVSAPAARAPLPSSSVAAPLFHRPPIVVAPVPAAPAVVQLAPIDVVGFTETRPGVTELNQEAIGLTVGARIDEAIREIPGVFTRINPQQPGVAMNIRGFEGSGRVNTMVDGVRQNFRFTGHEAQGFTYVDQNLLAGVDVARGAETGVGGGGLAGSVNFRTLGVSDLVQPGRSAGGLTRLSWGSNGVGLAGVVGGGIRHEGLGVAGAISVRDSDDYKNGRGQEIAYSGQDLVSGLVKAELDFGGDHSLNLGGVFYENEFAANSYHQTLRNTTATAGYRYNPESELIDLQANLRFNDIKTHYDRAITTGSAVGRELHNRGIGGDLANTSYLNFGDVGLTSTNGFEVFRDDLKGRNGGVNPDDGDTTQLAAFTDNTLSYGIFDLNAGLRYDRYTVNGEGVIPANAAAGTPATPYKVDISKGALNPSVTLAAEPIQGVRPYVKWARSLRAPTLQETLLGGTHPGGATGSFRPNPNLRPERQETIEVGARVDRRDAFQPGDRVTARANYYWMDVEDYIVSERNSRFVNAPGESKVQGFELDAGYDAGPWFARVAYSHAESKLPAQTAGLGAGQYLPDDTVSLTGGLRLLDRKLTLGGTYNYVSGGTEVRLFPAPLVYDKKDSYGIVDLFANYQISENFSVGAKLINAFDKPYRSWFTPAPVSFGPSTAPEETGMGRAFFITGEAKF